MKTADKNKILSAQRLYLTEEDDSDKKAIEIRIQFPNKTFTVIDFSEPVPESFYYQSLIPNGFGLSDDERNKVITYSSSQAISILKASRDYGSNNSETVDWLIEMICRMKNLVTG